MIDYEYRVCRPYTVCLHKANPIEPARKDFITLFLQPVSEERCVAHPYLSYLSHEIDAVTLRSFQQMIFGQDRPYPGEPGTQAAAARPPGRNPRAFGRRVRLRIGAGSPRRA